MLLYLTLIPSGTSESTNDANASIWPGVQRKAHKHGELWSDTKATLRLQQPKGHTLLMITQL